MKNSNTVIQSKEEKKMKITTIVKVSVYAATLGFAFMLPVTAHAQMDVAPDEFAFSAPATTAAQPVQVAAANASGLITGQFESGQKAKVKGVMSKTNGYMIEIAGYASSTGTKEETKSLVMPGPRRSRTICAT
jgi:hypothetical protein